jgi:ATP-dependent DNA helicase 2 subunit 2
MLMGEVRYMWPDQSQPKAQIQFSSFVEALMTTGMAAITRWVYRDGSDPDIGVAVPDQTFPGEGKKLDLMYWARLPYADDEHKFYFPSLTKLKTAQGKDITEHPYIPTKQQCDLMDELVKQMDLDTVKPPKVPGEESEEEEEDEDLDEDSDMEDADKDNGPKNTWFNPARSVNPSLHRIKEAIFHSALTPDLDANPLPPPHPELTQYMKTPEELGIKVEKITEQLKAALDIKKVPPRTRKRAAKEGMREDEGL